MVREDEDQIAVLSPVASTAPPVVPQAPLFDEPVRRRRGSTLRTLLTWVPFLAFVAGSFVVLTTLKPYRIISGSMAPTANVGQRVFADHVGSTSWRPSRGDIIVFKAPGGARDDSTVECADPRPLHTACLAALPGRTDISFVKRVVGLPGDRIQIVHGHVIRNGQAVREPYARTCDDEICDLAAFIVPAGHYYVLGDNRGDSSDSRYWGPITHDEIVGRVVATYWPPSRVGAL